MLARLIRRHIVGQVTGRSVLFDRRIFLAGALSTLAGACTTAIGPLAYFDDDPSTQRRTHDDEAFPVPHVNMGLIPAQFHRQVVRDPTGEKPGTVVVDPGQRFLYLTMADGRAIRYGIGVGRQGFAWSGQAVVGAKQKWPRWHPPVEMQARDEHARQYANGMDAGPGNPLGARAMYLYQNGRDTLYRIHGTNEPLSIGKAMSSGCIRMLDADVIDLYDRVPIGTRVVVLPAMSPLA
jgi:lipoprotein-anchoring transpeptidase ErfK/SrfK